MSRKQAAKELHNIQKCYEVKPLKLSTVYRKIYRCGDLWKLSGRAHNYSV